MEKSGDRGSHSILCNTQFHDVMPISRGSILHPKYVDFLIKIRPT